MGRFQPLRNHQNYSICWPHDPVFEVILVYFESESKIIEVKLGRLLDLKRCPPPKGGPLSGEASA